jgi:SAM-dependent methyltransferase
MLQFICNVCGEPRQAEEERLLDPAQPPSCDGCGSNVRARAIVHLFSLEFFGTSLPLPDFPRLESLRGMGLSDWAGYADRFEDLFSYHNTYYHLEPKFDIAEEHPQEHGRYDFVIASEVFEHVRPPVERALAEARRLLAPGGRLILSVPYSLDERTVERFPSLYSFTVAEIDGSPVLVNRRADGALEAFEGLIFHRGPRSADASLEVRVFSRSGLEQALRDAGFTDVTFCGEACLRYGILHHEWSQPVVARRAPGVGYPAYIGEMARRLGSLRRQSRLANQSRWSRLGRRIGVGPTINLEGKVED